MALMIQVGALSALGLDGLVPPPAQLFLVGFLIACAAIGSGMWLIIERQAVKQWEALQLKTKPGKEHAQLGAAGIDSKWSFQSETSSMSPLGTSPSSVPRRTAAGSVNGQALVCNPPQPTVRTGAGAGAGASPAPSPLCRPVTPHGMVGGSDGAGGGASPHDTATLTTRCRAGLGRSRKRCETSTECSCRIARRSATVWARAAAAAAAAAVAAARGWVAGEKLAAWPAAARRTWAAQLTTWRGVERARVVE